MVPRQPAARRLTLAPAPVAMGVLEEMEEEVQWSAEASLSMGKEERRQADPLAGCRAHNFGSRFWPLADELSSDDEEEKDEVGWDGVRREIGRNNPVFLDSARRAPELLQSEAELTSNGCVSSSVAGSEQGMAGDSGGRKLRDGKPSSSKMKPWRGPLPPARASPKSTLADALARARFVSGAGANCRTSRRASAGASSPFPVTASLSGVCPPGVKDSNFELPRPEAQDLGRCGHLVGEMQHGLDRSFIMRLGGREAQVTFPAGLVGLFARVGSPRCLLRTARSPPSLDASFPSRIEDTSARVPSYSGERGLAAEGAAGDSASRRCEVMDRRNVEGRGRGLGADHGAGVERFSGGDGGFQVGGLGFDPGYGDDRGSRGRGWPWGGARFRGSRGFTPRRGGYAGRQWRGVRSGRHGDMDVPVAPVPAATPVAAGMEVDQDTVTVEDKEAVLGGGRRRRRPVAGVLRRGMGQQNALLKFIVSFVMAAIMSITAVIFLSNLVQRRRQWGMQWRG